MNAYTLGLLALVLVLVVVLWMRRPRGHRQPTAGRTVEFYAPSEDAARRLVASLERVLPGKADVRAAVREPEWAVTYVVQATVSAIVQPEMVERFVP